MQNAAKTAGFGQFAPDVLIGNYQLRANRCLQLHEWTIRRNACTTRRHVPLVIPGLRTIHFGPGLGVSGQNPPKTQVALFFTEDPIIGDNVSIYGEITPFGLALVIPW